MFEYSHPKRFAKYVHAFKCTGCLRHHERRRRPTCVSVVRFGFWVQGYGNNAVEMETTATLDKGTDEWIINTPTTVAQKYWITNGSIYAHWAVVFAQVSMQRVPI